MTAMKHTLELLINPFFALFCLLLLCFLLLRKERYRGLTRGIMLLVCVFILLFGTGWIPRAVTNHLEAMYPVIQQVNPEIKWIVVLGGGRSELPGFPANDLLTGASIKRLVEGVRLLHQLPHARLLLSGGGGSGLNTEAALLKQLSLWFAVPVEKIVLESKTLNTEEQARALASLLHQEPFYLVTSAIHMPRSIGLCHQQGLNPIPAPTDFTLFWSDSNQAKMYIPNAYNFYFLTIALHEILGQLWSNL